MRFFRYCHSIKLILVLAYVREGGGGGGGDDLPGKYEVSSS